MLNPQKRFFVLATFAVLALVGVVGVVAKKKMGTHRTATSTETSAESGQAGAEPDSEPSRGGENTYAHPGGPALSLAMLSPSERARIEKEYPEFKNAAPRVSTAPERNEPTEVSGGAHSQQTTNTANTDANTTLPKLTLAMLSPAERERVQKKYPELFKGGTTGSRSGSGNPIGSGIISGNDTDAKGPTEISQAPKPGPAADSCYTVTFHHKHPGMRSGDETCAHHKNLIRIHPAEGLKINPKTVCIRVSGTPVKFTPMKGKPTDFVIGIVVGIETAVTARYCTGKFRCNEDCKVPKDEFVESIAGSDLDSDESHKLEVAVWDKEDPNDKEANAKLAADMHKGLKDLDEVAKAAAEGYTLFENWIPDQQTLACQNHTAQGPAVEDDQENEKPHRKVASKR